MPTLTRWFIKSAMLYLVAALALSVAMQSPLADTMPVLRRIWPTYLHLLVVGWLTQLIFGVAFWMFPKYSAARPRGSDQWGWATLALLNIGLVLRAIGEPWQGSVAGAAPLLVASAVAQLLAGLAFVVNTWPRVKER